MKKKILGGLATMGLAAMLLTAGTMALFTATATSEGNTFATGTLVIEDISNFDGKSSFKIANIAPGATGEETFEVENTGSLDAWVKIGGLDTTGALFEGSNQIILKHDSHTGVHVPAGQTVELDVYWQFPLAAGNEYQGKSGSATVTFEAVQYDNNEEADFE